MCDHQCQFLDIFVRYQGSVHFKIAPCMFTACTNPEATAFWAMVNTPASGECSFRPHAKVCSVTERAFGIRKSRWRSFFFFSRLWQRIQFSRSRPSLGVKSQPSDGDGGIVDPVEEEPGTDDQKNELERDPQLGEWLCERMAAALLAPRKPLPALEGPDCY